jgi:hypothetical protein
VGSQVARALTAATATAIPCALIETAAVSGTEVSAGSGIYQTSVSGIGVSFYVVNGASQTLITSTSGGYTPGTINAPGNGTLPGIRASHLHHELSVEKQHGAAPITKLQKLQTLHEL